jgi:hypothetical protein
MNIQLNNIFRKLSAKVLIFLDFKIFNRKFLLKIHYKFLRLNIVNYRHVKWIKRISFY